jgi:hypothetical protein
VKEAEEFLLVVKETAEIAAEKDLEKVQKLPRIKAKGKLKAPEIVIRTRNGNQTASKALREAERQAKSAVKQAYAKINEKQEKRLMEYTERMARKAERQRLTDMVQKSIEKERDEAEAIIALLLK